MPITPHRLAEKFPDPPADLDLEAFDFRNVPSHVAIIMDGNGRWAKSRGLKRGAGHVAGIEGVRAAIKACNDLGIAYLTIYSFSTENWNRPPDEVKLLMSLFAQTMAKELPGLEEENARVKLIGRIEELPEKTRATFEKAIRDTEDNTGLTLVMAVNYGARDEIARAASSILRDYADDPGSFDLGEGVSEDRFSSYLFTDGLPDPDLLIRTSGEMRLSNFMLWQCAYSEFYITDVLWPDFDRYELLRAVMAYQRRNRRFGKV